MKYEKQIEMFQEEYIRPNVPIPKDLYPYPADKTMTILHEIDITNDEIMYMAIIPRNDIYAIDKYVINCGSYRICDILFGCELLEKIRENMRIAK